MTFGNVGFNEVDVFGAGGLREPLWVGHHVVLEKKLVIREVGQGTSNFAVQGIWFNFITKNLVKIVRIKPDSLVTDIRSNPIHKQYSSYLDK